MKTEASKHQAISSLFEQSVKDPMLQMNFSIKGERKNSIETKQKKEWMAYSASSTFSLQHNTFEDTEWSNTGVIGRWW